MLCMKTLIVLLLVTFRHLFAVLLIGHEQALHVTLYIQSQSVRYWA
jgi:hypothetical protein